MTRASLGHTGRDMASSPSTTLIYSAIIVATLARVAAPIVPAIYYEALVASAVAWLLAFGGFVLVYGPVLLTAAKRPSQRVE
jgi:uncharacterized protein involved in response to NO